MSSDWKEPHHLLYTPDGQKTAYHKALLACEADKPKVPGQPPFGIVRVSYDVKERVQACLEASANVCRAAITVEEMGPAYSHLNVCLETLYTYIADLEKSRRIPRECTLRF